MISANDLLEPRKVYTSQLKDLHHQNAQEFFDDLVKKSQIDVEANRLTVKKYKSTLEKIKNEQKHRGKLRALNVLTIIFIILGFAGSVLSIFGAINADSNIWLYILLAVFGIALGVGLIFLSVSLKKKINQSNARIEKLQQEADKLLKEAWAQMAPLNSLYDWNMTSSLMSKTCPLIELDKYFNPARFEYLHERFGFQECEDKHISTVFAQSGQILGNPFLFQKRYVQQMYDKAYSGSITIHWTTYTTINGKRQAVSHSQVLTATTYHPAPRYYLDTWLIYGNDAAPKLSFSRNPSNANNMSEKEIEKFVKSQDKKLDKMVEKDIGDQDGNGSEFTRLANTKFEALFHAFDRNNEVEFRLLFTPLAQRNLIELMTTKEPYGDDFTFNKREKINYIHSGHMQGFDLSGDPKRFVHYDHDFARENFTQINDEYFKHVFFDFAPLLAVPLYQQHKPFEYIYKNNYPSNITKFEHETLANSFNRNLFKHPNSNTDAILKSSIVMKDGEKDIVTIDAYSFKEIAKVEYVNKMGGDGRMHTIPVHYFEYNELKQSTNMVAQYATNNSQNEANNAIIKQRGLMAYIK